MAELIRTSPKSLRLELDRHGITEKTFNTTGSTSPMKRSQQTASALSAGSAIGSIYSGAPSNIDEAKSGPSAVS